MLSAWHLPLPLGCKGLLCAGDKAHNLVCILPQPIGAANAAGNIHATGLGSLDGLYKGKWAGKKRRDEAGRS